MKQSSKKLFLLAAPLLTALLSCSAFADTSTPPANWNPGQFFKPVTDSLQALTTEMQALGMANASMTNNSLNEVDSFFPVTFPLNNDGTPLTNASSSQIAALTQNQISGKLMNIPSDSLKIDQNSDPSLYNFHQSQNGVLSGLTTNLPGSDTLYASDYDNSIAKDINNLAPKPKITYDNYFNFDSLLAPDAYTSDQQTAAQTYMTFLTKGYEDSTYGLNVGKLNQKLLNLSGSDRANWIKVNLLNNKSYQQFQAAVRSAIALKSIALSNFNASYNERVAQKGLGTAAGLPQDPNLPSGYASPLQVKNSVIDSTINNPDWYKKMKTASPATLQREQLLLIATLVRQLQEQKETNERLLATMSAMTMAISDLSSASIQQKAQAVNQVIDPSSAPALPAGTTVPGQ